MPSTAPAVSVLIPVYNCVSFLEETVNSVFKQNFQNWEIIIVDDGSSDASLSVAHKMCESDSRIRIISQQNQGVAIARNNAFSNSRGKYLVFLDADDVIMPGKLETQFLFLEKNPTIDVVYGDCEICDSRLNLLHTDSDRRTPHEGAVFDKLCSGNLFAIHSAMVRRSTIESMGRVHVPRRVQIEDWGLWAEVSTRSLFAYLPGVVARYRQHSTMSNKSYGRWKLCAQRLYSFNRIIRMKEYADISVWKKSDAWRAQARYFQAHGFPLHARRYFLTAFILCPFNAKTVATLLLNEIGIIFKR